MPPLHDLIPAWPQHRPLAAIWAGPGRLSLLAEPVATFRVEADAGGCRSRWLDPSGAQLPQICELTNDPLTDLAAALAWGERQPRPAAPPGCPFAGGWIGVFSYDLGSILEPAVERGPRARGPAAPDRSWPLIELHWCPSALAVSESGIVPIGSPPALAGVIDTGPVRLGPLTSRTGREDFESSVERAIEYIRAGDVFQVNLAHRLSAEFGGSPRAAFVELCRTAAPWHGAYIEVRAPGAEPHAILSASPELFLDLVPGAGGSRLITRPMKGTRPASADPAELDASEKDRAELNMIIDLMRNDLGRVCRAVRVAHPRAIERHGGEAGVHQAVATIEGTLRDGVTFPDILRATFPPGSVTGAPKIRAMQIIDELEPVRRGPYCGSVGWISATGAASMNVAIRTALFERGRLDYSVGAGIVADSNPAAEWRETLDKAGILRPLQTV